MHASNVCYALGGLVGLLLLRFYGIQNVIGANKPLDAWLEYSDAVFEWRQESFKRFVELVFLWLCLVGARCLLTYVQGDRGATQCLEIGSYDMAFHMITFGPCTGLFMALMYFVLDICCGLEVMIDRFCITFYEDPDVSNHVKEWNMIQAILRRVACTIDSAFLALQTTVMGITMLGVVELVGPSGAECASLWFLSQSPLLIVCLRTLFGAAAVSEKCSRVPPLVNSLVFDENPIDYERQYMVQYITSSAAGFYVKGVRLTSTMVLKLTYGMIIVTFTLVTKVLTGQ
jgi:hypothetical protein